MRKLLSLSLLLNLLTSCALSPYPDSNQAAQSARSVETRGRSRATQPPTLPPVINDLEERTFRWFWDTTNPKNGLVPDRWPTKSFSSVAAVGFGLTAYPIGVERGWITREQARERVLTTLRFFWTAPQGPQESGVIGHRGFFYHFLDMETGHRFEKVELSTIDTALFLAGALFCQSYFDDVANSTEIEIRDLTQKIYDRVEWTSALQRPGLVSMAWSPKDGWSSWDYTGYNEAMFLYILALGSKTHPIPDNAWDVFHRTDKWATFYDQPHVNFAPLFGHQYTMVWIDFKGIRDRLMREKGIDWFENSRRAAISQRAYAIDNPGEWRGYGPDVWGLTACDGPMDKTLEIDGRTRTFYTYHARGAAAGEIRDDGTIAPTAAASSIGFAPEIAIPAIEEMIRVYGSDLFGQYGFVDAFNPTLTSSPFPLQHGWIHPQKGWFDKDYLGIDQGPIVAMIENHRTGLVWNTMKKNPHIVRGLRRAGFEGGWLDSAPK